MATLANIINNFIGAGSVADAAPRSVTWETSEECKLRALPNEDVYLFSKRIDNSRVIRQADPTARARDWKFVGGASFRGHGPYGDAPASAYGLMAGYQLSQLQIENQKLHTERARLEVRSSPAQRRAPAGTREDAGLHRSGPERTVYLEPKNDKSLAMNRQLEVFQGRGFGSARGVVSHEKVEDLRARLSCLGTSSSSSASSIFRSSTTTSTANSPIPSRSVT